MKKNYLFFFVHPSKFHVFRHTINHLKSNGHQVDILITSKDVLEDLVKMEGWNYRNIFSEGRKILGIPTLLSAAINAIRTLYRLGKYLRKRKYDLFITDDLLVVFGRIKKTPSLLFMDDDISAAKESSIVCYMATNIISPKCTNFGRFEHKKIPFYGYKELAYLHPNRLTQNTKFNKLMNNTNDKIFIIRLVLLKSTHDTGVLGIKDALLKKLIDYLSKHGKVYISSERELTKEFEKYRLNINVEEIFNYLKQADLFICDSQTMSAESALLGIPIVKFNGHAGKVNVHKELENRYQLMYEIHESNEEKLFDKIRELVEYPNIKEVWEARRDLMLTEKIDVSAFLIWLFENFPHSKEIILQNPDYQNKFK